MSECRLYFHYQTSKTSIPNLPRAVRAEGSQPAVLERLQRVGQHETEGGPEPAEPETRHAHATPRKRGNRGRRVSAAN